MNAERIVRIVAGSFILLSLALGIEASPIFASKYFLFFTAFVGLNLFQSRKRLLEIRVHDRAGKMAFFQIIGNRAGGLGIAILYDKNRFHKSRRCPITASFPAASTGVWKLLDSPKTVT